MTDNRKTERRGLGRAAFLARRDDFQRLLDGGHPMRAIYEDNKDALGIGYPQFTRYVSRYIRKADHDRHQKEAGSGPAAPSPAGRESGPASPPQAAPAAQPKASGKPASKPGSSPFYDANAGNDRDDLI